MGTISTTSNGNDPSTVLTIIPVPGRSFSVYIRCYDGYYISGNSDGYLLRWNNWGPDAWERHDILEVQSVPAIRGPNVGSWLSIERWMVPNLYPNPMRYNDGTSVSFQSLPMLGLKVFLTLFNPCGFKVSIQSVSTGKWLFSGDSASSVVILLSFS